MSEEPESYTEPHEVSFRRWVERCVSGEVRQQVQNDRFWNDLRELALGWMAAYPDSDDRTSGEPK